MPCLVEGTKTMLFIDKRDVPVNTPQKGSPIHHNHIISERLLEKITQVMSYINLDIPKLNDPFFQQIQMQEYWNKNMTAHFYP